MCTYQDQKSLQCAVRLDIPKPSGWHVNREQLSYQCAPTIIEPMNPYALYMTMTVIYYMHKEMMRQEFSFMYLYTSGDI
jgi:hypothetical protein